MSSRGPKPEAHGQRRPKKGRLPLTSAEILELDRALVKAFQAIRDLRSELPAAKHIKSPPLPSIFSESIIIAAAPRLFGAEWSARYGGTACDVLIENDRGMTKRVEVKATGEHAFQEFKPKDLRADFLIWVRFGRRFNAGDGPIEIAILAEPSQFITDTCRLDTTRLERRVGQTDALRVMTFESLEALLS